MKNAKIFNIDGLQLLSDLGNDTVDLVLTDPPYITSRETGMDKWVAHVATQDASDTPFKSEKEWEEFSAKTNWDEFFGEKKRNLSTLKKNYLKYGSIYGKKYAVKTQYGSWDKEFTLEKLNLFVQHFHRVLKPGGTCIIFFDLWKLSYLKEQLENAKFKQLRFIEWIKTNPQPINSKRNYLTNCREIALLAVKGGKPTFNSSYDKGIYEYPIYGGKERFHPTQKSLPLFEDLIEKHSSEGDIVLDCFLGSGTTAVAALNNDRKFIGCELEKAYFEKSLQRINRLALEHKDLKLKESVV